jgi:hypothetical protein
MFICIPYDDDIGRCRGNIGNSVAIECVDMDVPYRTVCCFIVGGYSRYLLYPHHHLNYDVDDDVAVGDCQ